MFSRIISTVRQIIASERGSVAVQLGVGLVALVGLVGLGTEGSYLIYKHREAQSAADSAALSGVMALGQAFPRDAASEARAVAARLGFGHDGEVTSVTVNVPPLSGTQIGNPDAVEVIISQSQNLGVMQVVSTDSVTVSTRAVAMRSATGRACILALDPEEDEAVYIRNNGALLDPNCGLAINSTSESALYVWNNAIVNGSVVTRGNWVVKNNAELNGKPLINHGPMVADPYADVELDSLPPCTGQSGKDKNNVTRYLTPGRFCDGWDFMNNVQLNLAPGTYYIDDKLKIKNNVVVNGQGVTIVINGDFAIDLGNNSEIDISAPTSGNYAGLAMMSRRDADPDVLHRISNNAELSIIGAIYFPNQIFELDNNGVILPTACTHIISRMVRFMNNATVKNDCDGTGVRPISAQAQLVE